MMAPSIKHWPFALSVILVVFTGLVFSQQSPDERDKDKMSGNERRGKSVSTRISSKDDSPSNTSQIGQVPDGQEIKQGQASEPTKDHTVSEIVFSVAVLLFGLIIICLQILLMMKQGRYWDSYSTKMVGLTMVITAGIFLIPAGYSQNQIAPMIGLLGTVVGYLLGQEGKATPATPPSPQPT